MLVKIQEAVYFTVWKLYFSDKVKLRLCVCTCARVWNPEETCWAVTTSFPMMMWMATQTRKEGFKQEIYRDQCTENLYLKPRRMVVLLFVLRPWKEKLGGRWWEAGGPQGGSLGSVSAQCPRGTLEAASRKSIPFKVKRTENAADPGKFLLWVHDESCKNLLWTLEIFFNTTEECRRALEILTFRSKIQNSKYL